MSGFRADNPNFAQPTGSNVHRVMSTLSDRMFTAKAMKISRGTNKGRDAVPNGEGSELCFIPVLAVCAKGTKDVDTATRVCPCGPDSFIGLGLPGKKVQGFSDPWKAIDQGYDSLRRQSIKAWAKLSEDQRDTMAKLSELQSTLAKFSGMPQLQSAIEEEIRILEESSGGSTHIV